MPNVIAAPHYDNWKELAVDSRLTIDDLLGKVRRLEAQVEGLQKDLSAARLDASTLRLKLANERNANKRMHDSYIPIGDTLQGYFCSVCNTEFDHPFEDCYCTWCGTKADWRTRNDEMGDENAYDLAGDR